jgi:hypothetical protein
MNFGGALLVGGTIAAAAVDGGLSLLIASGAAAYGSSKYIKGKMRGLDQEVCEDQRRTLKAKLKRAKSDDEIFAIEQQLEALDRDIRRSPELAAQEAAGFLGGLGGMINPVAAVAAIASMKAGRIFRREDAEEPWF